MKPISLKISAFGPYAKPTILNFKEDLKNQDIFVITGPTGAGKTTIFDAICYALYGETSGNNRRGEELRSDFASQSDDKTEVEFIFEVKDKQYCINRMPKQFQKKKRGDGMKEVPASVELRELNSERAPLTKEGDVKNEIQLILGLSVDQFRKIVMIPQGDFKEFLYANTTSKEELLRKIFGTHFYKEMQEQLTTQANALKLEVADTHKDIQSELKVLKCEAHPMLRQMIENNEPVTEIMKEVRIHLNECQSKQDESRISLKQVELDLEQQTAKRQHGALLNQKFSQLEQLEQKCQQLSLSQPAIAVLEEEVMLAKKAAGLVFLENEVVKQQVLVNQTLEQQEESKRYLNQLAQDFILVKNCYEGIADWQEKVTTIVEEMSQLSRYSEELEQIERCRYQVTQLQKQAHDAVSQYEEGKKRLEQINVQVNGLQDLQVSQAKLKESLFEQQLAYQHIQQSKEKVGQLYHRLKACSQYQVQLVALRETLKMKRQESESARSDYEHQATLFVNAAAIRLANELQIGEACPVCGSLEHPNPRRSDEVILTKSELDARRFNVEKVEQEVRVLEQQQSALEATLKEEKRTTEESVEGLVQFGLIKEEQTVEIDQVITLGQQLAKEMETIEQQLQVIGQALTQVEQELTLVSSLKEKQQVIEQQLKQLELEQQSKESELSGENRLLADLIQRIPSEYQDYETLKSKINELKQQKNQIEQNIRQIQADYQRLMSEMAATEATVKTLDQQLIHYQTGLNAATQIFTEQLEGSFSSQEAYHLAKREENEIEQSERKVTAYVKEVHATQSQLEVLQQELDGQSLVNLEMIDEIMYHLNGQKEELLKQINTWDLVMKHNKQILKSVERSYQLIQNREEEYRVIGELAELANGRSGGKMSFETYVLSSYFDDVLQAANQRLEKMTARRYYLLRREEVKGGGRKGLDLDVYDSHTCKKRPVNTLSGGESFKASLALALGLSDTVQQNTGGIQLDTMFIDEGFGTLDSESLEQAIDILMELQDHGRLIGVISHVNELKERIPSKLVVEMDINGSRAYFKR